MNQKTTLKNSTAGAASPSIDTWPVQIDLDTIGAPSSAEAVAAQLLAHGVCITEDEAAKHREIGGPVFVTVPHAMAQKILGAGEFRIFQAEAVEPRGTPEDEPLLWAMHDVVQKQIEASLAFIDLTILSKGQKRAEAEHKRRCSEAKKARRALVEILKAA